jgi:hypothetical protein
MVNRYVCGAIAAGIVTCGYTTLAQTSRENAPEMWKQMAAQDRAGSSQGTPVTMVGCIQRESDYRRENKSGKGGAASTGAGLANEYVLVGVASAADADCTVATLEAYELTGNQERQLEPFIGKIVQITGMMKDAKLESSTVGIPQPTGGFDPLGQDLRLREIEVSSFSEPSASPSTVARAEPQQTTPAPRDQEVQRDQEPRPTGTSGQTTATPSDNELPRTASPIPLAGLLGLLSIAGATGVRALRRR